MIRRKTSRIKRVAAGLLAVFLAFSSIEMPVRAEDVSAGEFIGEESFFTEDVSENEEPFEAEASDEPETSDEETAKEEIPVSGSNLSYHGVEYRRPIDMGDDDQRYYDVEFPSSYNKDIPSIRNTYPPSRNQDPWGTCWAHAALACAEMSMIKQGYADNNDVDYSELALAYFFYHTVLDPLEGLNGDYTQMIVLPWEEGSNTAAGMNYLNRGGNTILTWRSLATWAGVTKESNVPYNTSVKIGENPDDKYAFDAEAILTGAKYLYDMDDVKQAIMENGMVAASYFHHGNYYATEYNSFYLVDYNNWGINHAINIVGWDDNFPKDNYKKYDYDLNKWFDASAPGDGAWLIRNSWTNEDESKPGLDSYFWMSYYEPSLNIDPKFALSFVPADTYDNNYQYDGAVATRDANTNSNANIFTVGGAEGAFREDLKAVSFSISHYENTDYSIEIYTGVSDASNPLSGELAATLNGTTDKAGYYTIELDQPIVLERGTKFSVVVTTEDGAYIDREATEGGDLVWYYTNAHCDEGESFYFDGYNWNDYGQDLLEGNVCIKAFTCDEAIDENHYKIVYDGNGNTSGNMKPHEAAASELTQLSKNTFVKTNYYFDGWNTEKDGTGTAYSDEEVITGIEGGTTLILYAQWKTYTFSVVYDGNGATSGDNIVLENVSSLDTVVLPICEFEKEGYYFVGWSLGAVDSEDLYNPEDVLSDLGVEPNGIYTIYAVWQQEEGGSEFTIFFDANGGRSEISSKKVFYSEMFGELPVPELSDAVFIGWFTAKFGGELCNEESILTEKEDITLYAHWVQISTTSSVESNYEDGSELKIGDKIKLSCINEGVVIYYTLDGAEPNEKSNVYRDPIVVSESGTITIKAFAAKKLFNESHVSTFTYTVLDPAEDWGELTEEDISGNENAELVPKGLWVSGIPESVVYKGSAYTFNLRVYNNKKLLVKNKDYKITYKNNINAGTATVTITGLGNYRDSLVRNFAITPAVIDPAKISIPNIKAQNKAGAAFSNITVIGVNNAILKKGTDYEVVYTYKETGAVVSSKVVVPKGTEIAVSITGKGNYRTVEAVTGSYTVTGESIVNISSASVSVGAQTYTGEPVDLTGKIKVTVGKKVLKENEDYYISGYSDDHTNKGTAVVTISGIYKPEEEKYYIGSKNIKFSIKAKSLSSSVVLKEDDSVWEANTKDIFTFENVAIQPAVKLVCEDVTLKEGVDYTVKYTNNVNATKGKNIPTVTITGKGNYSGTVKRYFTVSGRDINSGSVSISDVYSTGAKGSYKAKLVLNVLKVLKEGKDYKVAYYTDEDCTHAVPSTYIPAPLDTYFCKITGIGNYTGSMTLPVTALEQIAVNDENLKVFRGLDDSTEWADEEVTAEYNKKGSVCEFVIKVGEDVLTGNDYSVKYTNNKARKNYNESKAPYITVTFKGKYKGTKKLGFSIVKADISSGSMTASDKVYSSSKDGFVSAPTVFDAFGNKLKAGTDYSVTYKYAFDTYLKDGSLKTKGSVIGAKDAPPVGTYIQAVVTGKGNYEGEIKASNQCREEDFEAAYKIVSASISKAKVSIGNQIYTGFEVTPGKAQISVTVGKTKLSPADYEIVGYSKNIAKGTAKVVLRGVGNYMGSKTATFKIVQKTMYLSIVFFGNGSTSGSMKNILIASGKSLELPGIAYKRAGFDVNAVEGCWNTKPDGSGVYYSDKGTINNEGFDGETITLYAQWVKINIPIVKGVIVKKPLNCKDAKSALVVKWTPVEGVDGYTVYRSTKYNGVYTRVGVTTVNNYTDKGLADGCTYFYKIAGNLKIVENKKTTYIDGELSGNYGMGRTCENPKIEGRSYDNHFFSNQGIPAVNVKLEVTNKGAYAFVIDAFTEGAYQFCEPYSWAKGTVVDFAGDNEIVEPGDSYVSTWRYWSGPILASPQPIRLTFYAWYDGIYYQCTMDTYRKFTYKALKYDQP